MARQFEQVRKRALTSKYKPIPECYSEGLHELVAKLLAKKPRFRPHMVDVLHTPYVDTFAQAVLAKGTP